MSIPVIGVDLAKSAFRLRGIDASGKVPSRRELPRSELVALD